MANSRKIKFSLIGVVCACASLVIFSECSRDSSAVEKINSPITEDLESSSLKRSLARGFHKSVGGPIKKEVGNAWIDNYMKKNGNAFTYPIESNVITEILENPSTEGIVLHYAIDSKGTRHILATGVTSAGKIIKPRLVSTSEGTISWEDAVTFINNYSGPVKAHFFGKNTFHRLIDEQGATAITATSALDEDYRIQLLLSPMVSIESSRLLIGSLYEDKSFPCPPCYYEY